MLYKITVMQIQQAFKFELQPNGAQSRSMRQFGGARRFVFNKALALQQSHYASGGKFISYVDMAKKLTDWRNGDETPWLKDAPVHPLQHALKDLDKAYKNFFKGLGRFPRFKKKSSGDSFRFPDAKQFEIDEANSRIKLPKLGWVKYRNSRDIIGVPRNITLSSRDGKWFASIQTQREVDQPVPAATSAIGVDLGIANFAAFSDESFVAPLSSFKAHEVRLARYQRRMSRKVKGSANWRRAKARVQRMHTRIANARRDFLHKTSCAISRSHALVVVEDLAVSNMSRRAKVTEDKPSKSVKAKSGLNKAILDQGWAEFRRQLEYKLKWNGGTLLAVPAHHTSQTCPECGNVSKDNRQTQSRFACVACGHTAHADTVGAINILARGHRVSACGEDIRHDKAAMPNRAASLKQEPTKGISCEATHA